MRLIAFDLDGTLLDDDKIIPERSLRAVGELRAHGCVFAVITGRARVPDDVMEFVQPEAFAVNNGGTVTVGDRVVAEHLLTPEQTARLLQVAPQGTELTAHSATALYAPDLMESRFRLWAGDKALRPLSEVLSEPVQKFNFIHPDAWQYAARVREIPDVTVTGGVEPYPHFLTVTAAAANKGQALQDIARALDVPLERTIAFGDSDNDHAMFRVAGTAVQVGDAECLREVAHQRVSCSSLGLPGWLEDLSLELARELAGRA